MLRVKLLPWYDGAQACTAWRSCSATAWPRAKAQPGSTTANSSPPTRAAQPSCRTCDSSSRATWRSASSPASCPARSFTTVKWSKSMNNTTPSPAAAACGAAPSSRKRVARSASRAPRRSSNAARLNSWVSASCSVSQAFCCCASRAAVMSSRIHTVPPSMDPAPTPRPCTRAHTGLPSLRMKQTSPSNAPCTANSACTLAPARAYSSEEA